MAKNIVRLAFACCLAFGSVGAAQESERAPVAPGQPPTEQPPPSRNAPKTAGDDAESKAHEAVLTATRDTAQVAMTTTKETASAAIEAAKLSNETVSTVFQWATGLLAALVVSLSILGFNQVKNVADGLRASFDSKLSAELKALSEKAETELKALREKSEQQTRDIVSAAMSGVNDLLGEIALMAIEEASLLQHLPGFQKNPTSEPLRNAVATSIARIKASAEKLKHRRTMSWVLSQEALVHFHAREYAAARTAQLAAIEANEAGWRDRHYNLACICTRLWEGTQERAHREEALEALRVACEQSKRESAAALADEDLKSLLAGEDSLRAWIKQQAGLA